MIFLRRGTKVYKKEDMLQMVTFSKKERSVIRKKMKEYQIEMDDYINTMHKSMMIMLGADLASNLIAFFNQDILLNACICKSIGNGKEKKLSYYLEIFYTKLATGWEYLFVYMNEILQTGLIPNEQVKRQLIESSMYEQVMIQHDGHVEIKYIPYDEEKQQEIRRELKKSYVVLAPWELKKRIGEMYEESELIKSIFDYYSDELVKDSKYIRNAIIHSDSIQKSYSFGVDKVFGGTAICSRNIDYYKEMVEKIDRNIVLLRKAILLFWEIVREDKIPNRIENAGRVYTVFDHICSKCGEVSIVPDRFEECFERFEKCRVCGEKEFNEKKKYQVSELYYGTLLSNYLSKTLQDDE